MAHEIKTQEGSLVTSDGARLYTKTWLPVTQPPRARLAFLHGFSDHCNFYETLFVPLALKGIQVHSFDQRGWGRSVNSRWERGRTGPTAQVMSDITAFLNSLSPPTTTTTTTTPETPSLPPLFLMGHSMGGGETLVYAATGPAEVVAGLRGVLAEAPLVGLHPSSRPWDVTVALGRLAGRLLPNMPKSGKLEARKVCRDAEVVRRYEADPLCHDTGTLAGLAGMLDRAGDLESGRVALAEGRGEGGRTRLWIGHGTGDEICAFAATRAMFERAPLADKELRAYEGWYHKLHTEPGEDKVVFANDVASWILDRSGPLETLNGPERAKL